MKNKPFTHLVFIFSLICSASIIATAQKLPGVQKTSIPAPANINIDGQATEWGNTYQAFNKPTGVFYSIANDRDNLYLIIHSTRSRVIEKMLEGGISFVIANADNKDRNTTVLFPLLTMPVSWSILHNAGKTLTENYPDNKDTNSPDPYGIRKNLDSVLATKQVIAIETANTLLEKNLKEIKVSGTPAITDTVTGMDKRSIYYRSLPLPLHHFKLIPTNNKDGIKATLQFDTEGTLIYELALSIKHIASAINNNRTLSYQIILNARSDDQRMGSTISYGRSSRDAPWLLKNADLETPTSLKGEYTLTIQ